MDPATATASASERPATRRPIGEFLVERGLVTPEQLQQALRDQKASGKRLGETLVERGAITRMALASVLGEQWEEAGRHLRAVVPVRLADGRDAEGGLTGGEELAESLASLQAAVARLEDLSSTPQTPAQPAAATGTVTIDEALGDLRLDLSDRLAAVEAVVADHGQGWQAAVERMETLRGELIELARTGSDDARLDEVALRLSAIETAVTTPAAEPDAVGVDLETFTTAISERLAAVEAALAARVEELGAQLVARLEDKETAGNEEIAPRLDQLEETLGSRLTDAVSELTERIAATEWPVEVDLDGVTSTLSERLAALEGVLGSLGSDLAERVAAAAPEDLSPRLDRLEQSLLGRLGELAPREDDRVVARLDELAERVSAAAPEDLSPRLDRLEQSLLGRLGELVPRENERLTLKMDGLAEAVADLSERISAVTSAHIDEQQHDVSSQLEGLVARFQELDGQLFARLDAIAPDRVDDLFPRFDRLEQAVAGRLGEAVAELSERIAGATSADHRQVDSSAQLEGLAARLAELGSHLTARLDGIAASRPDDVTPRIDQLERSLVSRVDEVGHGLVERIAGIESAISDAPAPESHEGLHRHLAELTTTIADRFSSLESRLETRSDDELVARLEELQALVAEQRQPDPVPVEELASRDARIEELTAELAARPLPRPITPAPRYGEHMSFLAFVHSPDGYRLLSLEGPLPGPGSGVEVADDERRLVVSRLGRSPYPGDARPCAYLEPA